MRAPSSPTGHVGRRPTACYFPRDVFFCFFTFKLSIGAFASVPRETGLGTRCFFDFPAMPILLDRGRVATDDQAFLRNYFDSCASSLRSTTSPLRLARWSDQGIDRQSVATRKTTGVAEATKGLPLGRKRDLARWLHASYSPGRRPGTARFMLRWRRPRYHRQALRSPAFEAALHVGRLSESQLLQTRRGQTRLIALSAHEDEGPVDAREDGVMMQATRVGAPFEDIALDEIRAGNQALRLTLAFRTNIDNEAAGACGLDGPRAASAAAVPRRACASPPSAAPHIPGEGVPHLSASHTYGVEAAHEKGFLVNGASDRWVRLAPS